MTTLIKAHAATATDFQAYLDAFDTDFVLSGFGAFSDGISGDYMGGASAITDVADDSSQAFALRGALEYDMATHTLGGTATAVEFGTGGSQDAETGALSFETLDFSATFKPELTDGAEVRDLVIDLMRDSEGAEGRTSTLSELIEADSVTFKGNVGDDVFSGGAHDDKLWGGKGDDALWGDKGQDVIRGGAGDDALYGNARADKLFGGAGDDMLTGGRGQDMLTGGRGADSFVFTGKYGRDTVTDFGTGHDVLTFASDDVSDFDAVMAVSRQAGDDVVINTDDGLVRLLDTDLGDLGAQHFDFI